MTRRRILLNLICLGAFLIAGGILSAALKYELLFDFLQYHYYNGFSFINDRLTKDLAVSAVPNYYNPLLDSLCFLLNKFCKENIDLYYFIMGLPFGLLCFLFFKITLLFFDGKTFKSKICIVVCLCIAVSGYNVWFQIGTSTHEIPIAVFVLSALYCLLKDPDENKSYLIAGVLLGAAAGLKLTAAIYCVSTGMTLILFYRSLKKPKTFIALLITGGFIGYLITNGFWALTLWKNFENPVFPFWNKIFKSPYYLDINYVDRLHLHTLTWFQRIFLPFYLIYHPYDCFIGSVTDLSDWRFAYAFIIAVVWGILKVFKKADPLGDRMNFYAVWIFISYLIWLFISANLRFTIPIETSCAVIFVFAGARIKIKEHLFKEIFGLSFLIILTGILLSTPFLSYYWGKRDSYSFLKDKISLPDNTLLITLEAPTAGFATEITEQNKNITLLGFMKILAPSSWKKWNIANYGKMKEKRDLLLKRHPDKVVLMVKNLYESNEDLFKFLPFDIHEWTCRQLSVSATISRIFVSSQLSLPQLCYPPEMKDKIIITK